MEKDQLPEDVLSLGDQVLGIVKHYDRQKQRCELSLLEYLQQLPVAPSERLVVQEELFPATSWEKLKSSVRQQVASTAVEEMRRAYRPPMTHFGCALVVDDNPADCRRIHNQLIEEFGIPVDMARSQEEAIAKVQADKYDIAVIDVRLGNAYGVTVAETLLALLPEMRVIFISSDPRAEQEIQKINGRTYPFVFKRTPEIVAQVDKERLGYMEMTKADKAAFVGRGTFVQQLEMEAFTRQPLDETLQTMLEGLQAESGASYAIVLETDAANKLATIVATVPPLQTEILARSQDGLYYSPLREVVETASIFHETKHHEHEGRFRYFFPLLPYKACYGTPLTIPGFAPRHALFLLDEKRVTFAEDTIQKAELVAGFIKIALERSLLIDFMHRYEERYSQGQLLGSLVHELRTKLGGLDAQSKRLAAVLEAADDEKARDAAEKIVQTKNELHELVESYSRMAKGDSEAVDANSVVEKVHRQLETRAKEGGVTITQRLQPNLPPVTAIQSRLEQVVLNVILNAIQQIQRQAVKMVRLSEAGVGQPRILQEGAVLVETLCDESGPNGPIRIIVLDSGPGIHYEQQERIFRLDTSTRETGHGLGLFISRNLIETMGGTLYLADSIIFVGSIFVIEIPQYIQTDIQNEE